jgi:hypothetical protein
VRKQKKNILKFENKILYNQLPYKLLCCALKSQVFLSVWIFYYASSARRMRAHLGRVDQQQLKICIFLTGLRAKKKPLEVLENT